MIGHGRTYPRKKPLVQGRNVGDSWRVSRTALMTFIVVGVVGCGFGTPAPTEELPKVYFPVDQSLTDESVGTTQIPVRLSMKTADVVTVRYAVTGGTAQVGRDVSGGDGEITFDPFQDTAMITIGIIDDGQEEAEESVVLTLKSPDKAELGDAIQHTLRISANKLPRVRFVAATSSAGEETGPQGFAIQLDTLAAQDVVVRYTWSGTAEAADHGVVDGFLTIPAGQSSQTLRAVIVNDPTDEYDETIDLNMIAQAGAVVEPGLGEHVHTIIDDDPPPAMSFQTTASSVSEGVGTAQLTVSLALASEKPITVDYAATGGSAGPGDFTLAAGTLTFQPGTTSLTVPVTITNDALDEDNETVVVTLSNATNATLSASTKVHTLTITDDDDPPTIEFQQGASTVSEGTATLPITVQLSAPSGKTVQFSVSRTGGTATAADLTVPTTTFSIPPGATTATFNVAIIDDTLDEDDETAVLSLGGLVNATAGAQATHTITIADNDNPPLVRFDATTPDRSATEANQTFTYRVILSAPSTKQITVPVTLGGSADNKDYDIGTGDIPVVFQPGQTAKDIRVIVKDDNAKESDETITLQLGTPTNATNAGDNQLRTHTIVDND
jgi:hypothetical protein